MSLTAAWRKRYVEGKREFEMERTHLRLLGEIVELSVDVDEQLVALFAEHTNERVLEAAEAPKGSELQYELEGESRIIRPVLHHVFAYSRRGCTPAERKAENRRSQVREPDPEHQLFSWRACGRANT